ncbi:MAG: hypothetical protein PHS37_06675 [Candidatus Omnitrophica bacterium]|nr:hypothetical protein [Candidatus Omnitrophota bacterium]
MKKLMMVMVMGLFAMAIAVSANAADQTQQSTVNATVGGIFSLSFVTDDANVIHSNLIPFSNVDPSTSENYSDGHAEGKTDVGLVCLSNHGSTWKLKVEMNGGSTLFHKLLFNMGQPTDRNTSSGASGSRTYGDDWYEVPATSTVLYTSGDYDKINTPYGVEATLTFKINGAGLVPGSHTATVTYTMAEVV